MRQDKEYSYSYNGVVEAIKATAKKEGLSMNEAISQAIQDYVEKHRH